MSPTVPATLPDHNRLVAVFDRYLPLIEPVGSAVLDHLPAMPDGARVLDVACGTGEPGLTLARRSPGVRVLGVDAAAGMVEVARVKAAREDLANVRFEIMAAETLGCADGSLDVVVSRFGLLMFGDLAASASELARVLRVGGHFSLAVWDDPATNTLVGAVMAALRPRVPVDLTAPFDRLGGAEAGERLRGVGLDEGRSELFRWHYEFGSEAALWKFIAGPRMFTKLFGELGETDKGQVRLEILSALAPYQQAGDSYLIPHACRLW